MPVTLSGGTEFSGGASLWLRAHAEPTARLVNQAPAVRGAMAPTKAPSPPSLSYAGCCEALVERDEHSRERHDEAIPILPAPLGEPAEKHADVEVSST